MTLAMTPAQRAFLDTQAALAVWRASKDVEAQVTHWLIEGRARTMSARACYRSGQRSYVRACETYLTEG